MHSEELTAFCVGAFDSLHVLNANLRDNIFGNRQKVDLVRHALGRLHGRNVRVDEDDENLLFLQRLDRLRTAVIEFARLFGGWWNEQDAYDKHTAYALTFQ